MADQMAKWAEEPASAPDVAVLGAGLKDMAEKVTAAEFQSGLERIVQQAQALHEKQVRQKASLDEKCSFTVSD